MTILSIPEREKNKRILFSNHSFKVFILTHDDRGYNKVLKRRRIKPTFKVITSTPIDKKIMIIKTEYSLDGM